MESPHKHKPDVFLQLFLHHFLPLTDFAGVPFSKTVLIQLPLGVLFLP